MATSLCELVWNDYVNDHTIIPSGRLCIRIPASRLPAWPATQTDWFDVGHVTSARPFGLGVAAMCCMLQSRVDVPLGTHLRTF